MDTDTYDPMPNIMEFLGEQCCRLSCIGQLQDLPAWSPADDVATAQKLRDARDSRLPTGICCVCSLYTAPAHLQRHLLSHIPNLFLLDADLPSSAEFPRHAHCTVQVMLPDTTMERRLCMQQDAMESGKDIECCKFGKCMRCTITTISN